MLGNRNLSAIRLLFLSLTLIMSACASVPMASMEADEEAKTFKVPANKSRICVFRDDGAFGAGLRVTAALDGKLLGQTAPMSYFVVDVEPGDHVVSRIAESNDSVRLNTRKNAAYYVWQGFASAGCALKEVPEAEGRKRVLSCKRAMSELRYFLFSAEVLGPLLKHNISVSKINILVAPVLTF